jgi:hypothetical protein
MLSQIVNISPSNNSGAMIQRLKRCSLGSAYSVFLFVLFLVLELIKRP